MNKSLRATTRVFVAACLATPLLANAALAQSDDNPDLNLKQEQRQAQPPVPNPPAQIPADTSHLFGNWAGFRPLLAQYGLSFTVDYFAEAGANLAGGRYDATGYADQRAVSLDWSLEKLLGISGFAVHSAFINRAGNGLSPKATGDNLYPAIEIAGGGGNVAVHMAYLYADEVLADGRLRVAAGRLQVGSVYSASPIYCEFASLSFCAEPRPLPGSNPGFTNGTASNYGGFVRGRPIPELYLEVGAFEDSPNRGGNDGFNWSTSRATGALLPVEIGWEPGGSAGQLPGHYKVGFYYDTSKHSDFYYDVNGNPQALTGLAPRQDKGQIAVWVEADQMLLRHGPGSNQGLVLFAGYAHTDGNVGTYQDEGFIGLDDHGLLPGRPGDSFGVMFNYGQQSNALAKTEQLELSLGETLEYGVATHEMVIEAEYTANLYRGVDAGPDIQYVIRPGASGKYPNAFVMGLQANVNF